MGPDPPISFHAGLEGLRGSPTTVVRSALCVSRWLVPPLKRGPCALQASSERIASLDAGPASYHLALPSLSFRASETGGISGTCGPGCAPDGAVLGCSRGCVNDMVQGLVTG